MKRSTVHVFSFILIFALLTFTFCACGKVEKAPGGTDSIADTSSDSAPETQGQTDSEQVGTESPDSDLGTEAPDTEPETAPDTEAPAQDTPKVANLRIISYNVLCELWNDRIPVPGRDKVVAGLIDDKLPHVVAFQELSTTWYSALDDLIGDKYAFVNKLTAEGKSNYSGLAYNKARVRLIQDGCEPYSVGDTDIRLMNWGYFELIDGGERFIVMSTHWNTSVDEEPKNKFKLVHAAEMGQRVKELALDFECHVIAAGDFNAGISTEEYKLYEKLSSAKDAMEHADERINADRYTMHVMGITPPIFGNSIDHITYTADAHALRFEHFIDQPYLNASDHTPLMCDFWIK